MKRRFLKTVSAVTAAAMIVSGVPAVSMAEDAGIKALGADEAEDMTEALAADGAADMTEALVADDAADMAETSAADDADVRFPVTVTDQLGREVTIETEPQTLVSGYYISTSMLIGLGLEDRLTGIEAKADTRPIYSLAAPELLELPNVGTAKEFDLEGCAALAPDLVIVPARLKDSIPALEELGMTVIAVKPEDDAMMLEALELIGEATGTQARADELVGCYNQKLGELSEALGDYETPSVYLGGNSSFLSTAGFGMYQNSMIERAGGSNVAAGIAEANWTDISYEQILAWNPDVILLAADASYSVDDVLADENLSGVTAVANGAVYQIPGSIEAWDSPVPACFLGSLWAASVLHGDLWSADDYQAAAVEFYETFYGFTPDMTAK